MFYIPFEKKTSLFTSIASYSRQCLPQVPLGHSVEDSRKQTLVKSTNVKSGPPGQRFSRFCDQEYFYSSVDGMLLHRYVNLSIKFAGTNLYTWVERGTDSKVYYPNTQRNVPETARSGIGWTNHEVIAPPNLQTCVKKICH